MKEKQPPKQTKRNNQQIRKRMRRYIVRGEGKREFEEQRSWRIDFPLVEEESGKINAHYIGQC